MAKESKVCKIFLYGKIVRESGQFLQFGPNLKFQPTGPKCPHDAFFKKGSPLVDDLTGKIIPADII